MTNRPITVHTASVHTATIRVQTLTLNAKQVTLSVFRQLREENFITFSEKDDTPAGVAWGWVNYCPGRDQCLFWGPGFGPHRHLVWQKGDELRRCAMPSWSLLQTDWGMYNREEADAIEALPQLFIAV